MSHKILVIEDDPDIGRLLQLNLQDHAFEVHVITHGNLGLEAARQQTHDLIILDLMLPGLDGIEVCRRLRAEKIDTPILMLTAKSSELDRVLGLELGADDYLTKPFSIMELIARVKAILRRIESRKSDTEEENSELHIHDILIDITRRAVSIANQAVELTAREFDLLLFFAKHPGRVYSRTQLLDEVWGYGHEGYEHTVNSHINRLRKKIEPDPHNAKYILTVWGIGYKFSEPDV